MFLFSGNVIFTKLEPPHRKDNFINQSLSLAQELSGFSGWGGGTGVIVVLDTDRKISHMQGKCSIN